VNASHAGNGSAGEPDFALLGDLLGDACETSGEPQANPRSAAPGGRRTGRTGAGSALPVREPRERTLFEARDPARRLAQIWPEIVGPEVAANARPVQLKRGRLTVSASSAAWAQTLQFMSAGICVRLQEALGKGAVEQVVFRHAGWDESPPRVSRSSPGQVPSVDPDGSPAVTREPTGRPLSEDQREALRAVEGLDLPADLRARIAKAMEAAFVRGGQDPVR
jgi:hypothetical protein